MEKQSDTDSRGQGKEENKDINAKYATEFLLFRGESKMIGKKRLREYLEYENDWTEFLDFMFAKGVTDEELSDFLSIDISEISQSRKEFVRDYTEDDTNIERIANFYGVNKKQIQKIISQVVAETL